MSKMDKYTIYCTPEQTKRAYKLGAPIKAEIHGRGWVHPSCKKEVILNHDSFGNENVGITPTAEQMRGWLEHEHGISVEVTMEKGYFVGTVWYFNVQKNMFVEIYDRNHGTRKDATLAAIDAALDYLEKGGNNGN